MLAAHQHDPVRQLGALDGEVEAAGVVAQPRRAHRRCRRRPPHRIEPSLERLERAVGRAVRDLAGPALDLVGLRVREGEPALPVAEPLYFDVGLDVRGHLKRGQSYPALVYRAAAMRSTFFVLILAAACGGRDSSTPDAAVHHDAPNVVDAPADAAPDSPVQPDAPVTGAPSRVWAFGDFTTNNTVQGGWFTDGDTLPVTPAMVPPGTAVFPTPTTMAPYTSFVFDATATTTAYVADVTTAGTFDLYVAGADGSNPTLLVAGQPNIEIATIALSPDGSKVAFMMDSATYDNAYDVWVVNTAGTPVPLLVSPTRPLTAPTPANLSAFTGSLTWSADSKYIGFSGDLTTDNIRQAYVVDTSAATPAAVALIADTDVTGTGVGARAAVLFDSNDNAYFRAGLTDNAQFTLFQATPDGTTKTALAMPMRGDNSTASAGAFAISPDGLTIAFSADAPQATTYDVYATPLAAWSPTRLTTATLANTNPAFLAPMAFSPDGHNVAFVADYVTDGITEPFVAAVDGSGTHRVTNVTVTNADAEQVAWTVDGTGL